MKNMSIARKTLAINGCAFDASHAPFAGILTARKRSLQRLCFHRCLSVHGYGRILFVLHTYLCSRAQDTAAFPAEVKRSVFERIGTIHRCPLKR